MPNNESAEPQQEISGIQVFDNKSSSSRKRSLVIASLIVLVLLGVGSYYSFKGTNNTNGSSGVASIKNTAPAEVSITSSGFVPSTITITAGQAVVWINKDSSPHWVASDPYPTDNTLAGFNARGAIPSNDTYGFVFDNAGTYTYHDDLNPYTMRGTVIVEK